MQLARHRAQIEAEITQIGNLSLRRAVAVIADSDEAGRASNVKPATRSYLKPATVSR
jgi:hypothetical protein